MNLLGQSRSELKMSPQLSEQNSATQPQPDPQIQEVQETQKMQVRSFTGTGNAGLSTIGMDEETGAAIRLDKRSPKMKFWGKLDTLSAWLGCMDNRDFFSIQDSLYKISGMLYHDARGIDVDWLKKEITRMERFCRKWEKNLSDEFVRSHGKIHYARCLTREAELAGWDFAADLISIEGIKYIMRYMNILSSYFFTYAECYMQIDDD